MKDILAFDLETTSAQPDTCRAVQIAATLFSCGTDTTVEGVYPWIDEICDPGLASSDGATAIHGITSEQWAGKRTDTAALMDFYGRLCAARLEGSDPFPFVVAGHNVKWFDLKILWRICDVQELFGLPVIDTMICAQRCYPTAPSHRLTTNAAEPDKMGLIEWLGLGPVEGAHTAAGDALMVYRLVRHFLGGLAKTPQELADWCAQPRILKTCHIGKHKGKRWGKPAEGDNPSDFVPYGYVKWISQNFNEAPDLEATIKKHWGLTFSYHFRRKE